jgi:hypothetical protein
VSLVGGGTIDNHKTAQGSDGLALKQPPTTDSISTTVAPDHKHVTESSPVVTAKDKKNKTTQLAGEYSRLRPLTQLRFPDI